MKITTGYAGVYWGTGGRLDEDEKGVNQIHTLGGNQNMSIIGESGLFYTEIYHRRSSAVVNLGMVFLHSQPLVMKQK